MSPDPNRTDRVYSDLRNMAATFAFKPNERINEGPLASTLGTSRTPLREALNRLAAEGFLTFQPGRGFFCRSLDPADILDLYEARQAVECEAATLAVDRASDADLATITDFLRQSEARYTEGADPRVLVELDEEFHMRLVRLAGNRELERLLANLNARSRFVRWIDMDDRRSVTPSDHLRIVAAIASRNPDTARTEMRRHIHRRREEATEAARKAFARIYVQS